MHIKENLSSAAQDLAGVQAAYANRGISLSELALCGAKEFVEWQHYPNNDLVDAISGYEFYYHSHSSDEMPKGEHGHFHLFKRHATNPEKFHHLIGIALDPKGVPVRIFTTNQPAITRITFPKWKRLHSRKKTCGNRTRTSWRKSNKTARTR